MRVWVNKDAQIPSDSAVWINTLGLLGEKYIEIMPGKDYNRTLKENDTILGQDPIPMEEITKEMKELVSKTDEAVTGLNEILSGIKTGEGTIGRFFSDETVYKNIEELTDDLKRHPWKLFLKPKKKRNNETMKTKVIFSCQNCGHQSAKWLGRCPDCSSWNSFVEEDFIEPKLTAKTDSSRINEFYISEPVLLKDIENKEEMRIKTGILELDRVLGGGVVKGAVTLLGGDPGIGKSTLSLQISAQLAGSGIKILYVSAEESIQQTKLRSERLNINSSENIYIVNQTNLSQILEYIKK